MARAVAAAVALFACSLQAAAGDAERVPLQVHAERLHPAQGVERVMKQCAACGDLAMKVRFLGCLSLAASGEHAELFGGLSGAYIHDSRLLMVSDTTKLTKAPWWGAGRFFTADLHLEPAPSFAGAPEQLTRPAGLQNVYTQQLKDRWGHILTTDKAHADTESLVVRWPNDAFIGVEMTHLLRHYAHAALDGPSAQIQMGTPTVEGLKDPDSYDFTGVGKALQSCSQAGGNNGAEALTLLPGGEKLLVVCEHNKPGAANDLTIAWTADVTTGDILAAFTVRLPEIEDKPGQFYRVSGVTSLPNTADLLILYHDWNGQRGNRIKVGRLRLPEDVQSRGAKPIALQPAIILELGEKDGIPLDNFETLLAQKVPGADGAYTLHFLSDNNFNEGQQRTLLLSFFLEEGGDANAQGKFNFKFELEHHGKATEQQIQQGLRSWVLAAGLSCCGLLLVLGVVAGRTFRRKGTYGGRQLERQSLVERVHGDALTEDAAC